MGYEDRTREYDIHTKSMGYEDRTREYHINTQLIGYGDRTREHDIIHNRWDMKIELREAH